MSLSWDSPLVCWKPFWQCLDITPFPSVAYSHSLTDTGYKRLALASKKELCDVTHTPELPVASGWGGTLPNSHLCLLCFPHSQSNWKHPLYHLHRNSSQALLVENLHMTGFLFTSSSLAYGSQKKEKGAGTRQKGESRVRNNLIMTCLSSTRLF